MHRELYYLSERLGGDLAAQVRRKPKPRVSLTLPIPGVSLTTSFEPSSGDTPGVNRHQLADEAMAAATDEAGTWQVPGRYIFVPNVPFKLWVFSFKGDDKRRPLAVSLIEPDFSNTLVILVGRASNVFGYHTERAIDGWIPSDPMGLRELGRFGRDADLDPSISELLVPDPLRNQLEELFLERDPPDLVHDAAYVAKQITRTPDREGRADLLAKVHTYQDEMMIELPVLRHKRMFSRILVGAAVFLREPSPRPFSDARASGSEPTQRSRREED
jgi:hypothetical protein